MRRADAGQHLSRIRWDDKANYLVKLSQEDNNRFAGDDPGKLKPGEWLITADGNDDGIVPLGLIEMCGNSEAQGGDCVCTRSSWWSGL